MQRILFFTVFLFSLVSSGHVWSAVTSSTSTSTTGSFSVSWSAVSGATKYRVKQSKNGGSAAQVYYGSSRSLSRSGLSSGSYRYTVEAELTGPFGPIPVSAGNVTVTVSLPSAPSRPGSISAPSTTNSLTYTVSWGASSGALTKYVLQERSNGGSWVVVPGITTGRSKSFTKSLNKYYDYRVKACNNAPCSSYTSTKRVTIPAASLSATVSKTNLTFTIDSFNLNWSSGMTSSCRGLPVVTSVSGNKPVTLPQNSWSYVYDPFSKTSIWANSFSVSCTRLDGGTISKTINMSAQKIPPKPTVNVSWNKSSVYVGTSAMFSWTTKDASSCKLDNVTVSSSKILKGSASTTPSAKSTITRKLVCTNAQGSTTKSASINAVYTTPGTPGAISGPSTTSSLTYTVSWAASSGALTKYVLEERVNGGSWATVSGVTTGRSKSFTKSLNKYYDYRVRACNHDACGTRTGTKRVTIPAASLTATVNSTNIILTTDSFNLTWNSSMTSSCNGLPVVTSVSGSNKPVSLPKDGWSYVYDPVSKTSVWVNSFSVNCTRIDGGTINKTINMTAQREPPKPTVNVSWNKSGAIVGSPVTFSWTTKDTSSCTLNSVAVSSNKLPNGSAPVTATTKSTITRTFICTNAQGSTTKSASINAVYSTPGIPGVISGPSTTSSLTYTVSWTASSGALTKYVLEERANGGSWTTVSGITTGRSKQFTKPLSNYYEYRVRACNHDSCSSRTGTKRVTIPAASISATVNRDNLTLTTDTFDLTWSSGMTSSCSGLPAVTSVSGSKPVSLPKGGWSYVYDPVSKTSVWVNSFTVNCIRIDGGTIKKTISMTAEREPPKPTVNVSWNKSGAIVGSPVTFSWTTKDTSSCTLNGVAVASNKLPNGSAPVTATTKSTITRTLACTNAQGSTSKSASINAVYSTPGIPGAISGPSTSSSLTYTVSWAAASGALTKYVLEERANGGSWTTVSGITTGRSQSFTKSLNKYYDYRVKTCNHDSCSATTATKRVTIPAASISVTVSRDNLPLTSDTFDLTWSSAMTNSCSGLPVITSVSGSKSTTLPKDGWDYVYEPAFNTSVWVYNFSINCTRIDGGTISKTIHITAQNIPPKPTVNVSWNDSGVTIGESATFSWVTEGTNDCLLDDVQLPSSKLPNGSDSTIPSVAGILTRTLECTNYGGSTFASAYTYVSDDRDASSPVDPIDSPDSGDTFMGYLSGSFSVGASGNANYSIPIEVPPGIRGMQPNLSLNYSSGAKNGLVGWGWNLSGLSRIHRCPASLIRDGRISGVLDNHEFKLCLDGQRLIKTGVNEYRTERESFRKITAITVNNIITNFMVQTGNGRTLEYGNTNDSRRENSDDTDYVDWYLNKTSDIADNYMTYHYEKDSDNGTHRIQRIEYTKNEVGAGISQSVIFEYEERDDEMSGYWAGIFYSVDKRLANIQVYVDSQSTLVRRYDLDYQVYDGITYADETKTSRLNEVKVCYDLSSTQCSDPIAIDWTSRAASDFDFTADTVLSFGAGDTNTDYLMADYDGDGVNEIIYSDDNNVYGIEQGETLNFDSSQSKLSMDISDLFLINAADLNNDGRADLVWLDNHGSPNAAAEGSLLKISYANDSGFAEPVTLLQGDGYLLYQYQFLDINGDGMLDIFRNPNPFFYDFNFEEITANAQRIDIAINEGGGIFSDFTSWGNRGPFFRGSTQFAEMNGDGLIDLVHCKHGLYQSIKQTDKPGCVRFEVSINNGSGYDDPVSWTDVASNPFVLSDMNGDGLSDLVWFHTDVGVLVRINDGESFGRLEVWFHEDITPFEWSFPPYSLIDVNVDGRPDLVYRLQGEAFDPQDLYVAYNLGALSQGGFSEPLPLGLNALYFSGRDFDGNGVSDLSFLAPRSSSFGGNWNRRSEIHRNNLEPNLVTGIRVNSEREVTIQYSTLNDPQLHTRAEIDAGDLDSINGALVAEHNVMQTQSSDQNGQIANYLSNVTGTRFLVDSVESSNGIGGVITDDYHYSGFLRHRSGWGGLGFQEVVMTRTVDDTAGSVEKTRTVSEYMQSFGSNYKAAGLLKSRTQYASKLSGVMQQVSHLVNEWHVQTLTDGVDGEAFTSPHYRIHQVASHTTSTDLNGTAMAKSDSAMLSYTGTAATACEASPQSSVSISATAHTAFDSYGNVHQTASLICDGTSVFTSTNKQEYENKTSGGKWVLGLVTNTKTTAKAPDADNGLKSLTREQSATYDYDGLALTQTREPGNTNLLRTTTLSNYDDFGTPGTVVESWNDTAGLGFSSRSSSVGVEYQSDGTRTITTTNALYQETVSVMEGRFGQLSSYTDINLLTTTSTFDALGRIDTITAPDLSTVVNGYYECDSCEAQSSYARFYVHSKATGASPQRSYFDAFGRDVGQRVIGLTGDESYTEIGYNKAGRVEFESQPFFDGASRYDSEYEYDSLGRVTHMTAPNLGLTTTQYNAFEITVTNALMQQRVQWQNGIGQNIRTQDNLGSEIEYSYDPFGNLEQTTVDGFDVAVDVITTMGYDLLGRQEYLDDPSAGRIDYTYNGLDLMVTSTDAENQKTEFTYDQLGRQKQRIDDATAANTNLRTHLWTYDTVSSGEGRLDRVTGYDTDGLAYSEAYQYNDYGLPTVIQTTIQGTTYETETRYDTLNRPFSIEYPTGYTVENQYNDYGYRDQITDGLSGEILWEATAADAFGNITSSRQGNEIVTTRVHDQATGRVSSIHAMNPNTLLVVQNQEFFHDELGNLLERTDQRSGVGYQQAFCYDALNRLKASREGSCSISDEDVTYDALGNIITRLMDGNIPNTYSYDPSNPYKLASTTLGGSYAYDNNGNITSGGGRGITYSSFDKPTLMTKDGNSVAITYSTNQNRIKRVDNGDITTIYVSGIYEKRDEGGITSHVHYVGDVALHVWKEENNAISEMYTRYLHHDNLGSIVAKSDENAGSAEFVEWMANDPWGFRQDEVWSGSILGDNYQPTDTRKGFTGHEHLDGVGLIHMNGRVYDPSIGRFLSADPFIQSPMNVQSFNRYAYVWNNPLSMTDPSGFIAGGDQRHSSAPPPLPKPKPKHSKTDKKDGKNGGYVSFGCAQAQSCSAIQVSPVEEGGVAATTPAAAVERSSQNNSSSYREITAKDDFGPLAVDFGPDDPSVEDLHVTGIHRPVKVAFLQYAVPIGLGALFGGGALAVNSDDFQQAANALITGAKSSMAAGGSPDPDDEGDGGGGFKQEQFVTTDRMGAKSYRNLVKNISKNGLKNTKIKYVVQDGVPYVVHGSNRLNAARYLGITNRLTYTRVNLPFRGYVTPIDLVRVPAPRLFGSPIRMQK